MADEKKATEKAQEQTQAVDPTQTVEQGNYTPQYKIKPEFKDALLKAIGDRPFNEIAGLINAINVEKIDHQTFQQVVNAIGQFPYVRVEKILSNLQNFVEQEIPED